MGRGILDKVSPEFPILGLLTFSPTRSSIASQSPTLRVWRLIRLSIADYTADAIKLRLLNK